MDFLKNIIFLGLALWIYFISSDVAISIVIYNKRIYSKVEIQILLSVGWLAGKRWYFRKYSELILEDVLNFTYPGYFSILYFLLKRLLNTLSCFFIIVILSFDIHFFLLHLKDIFWDKQAKLIQGVRTQLWWG